MLTMTKRLVDIDDHLLERARAATGEKTIRGTIEAALELAARGELLMAHIDFLCDPQNAVDPRLLDEARDPGLPLAEDNDE